MTDPHSSQQKALDLIHIQPGAVVSREILKKTNGSVTLFAFDKNEGLREHTSPYDALVYIIEGTADITIDGTHHRLEKDAMIHLPANIPHALYAVEPYMMLLIQIR